MELEYNSSHQRGRGQGRGRGRGRGGRGGGSRGKPRKSANDRIRRCSDMKIPSETAEEPMIIETKERDDDKVFESLYVSNDKNQFIPFSASFISHMPDDEGCICNRPIGTVFCGGCGFHCKGRLRLRCTLHPKKAFLLDTIFCPDCKSNDMLSELSF